LSIEEKQHICDTFKGEGVLESYNLYDDTILGNVIISFEVGKICIDLYKLKKNQTTEEIEYEIQYNK